MATFNPQAYQLYNTAIAQTQQKLNDWARLLKQAQAEGNAGAIGMLQAAIRQNTQLLKSYQAGAQQQQALYPTQVNEAGYNLQRGDVRQRYGAEIAAQDYGRTLAQQRHSRQLGDFNIGASRQREGFDSPFLQRGLGRSGIRNAALSRMREDQARGMGQLTQNQAQELAQIAQQRAAAQSSMDTSLRNIDIRRQQDIYNQLAGLRALGGK
jgi:hypothetical protein